MWIFFHVVACSLHTRILVVRGVSSITLSHTRITEFLHVRYMYVHMYTYLSVMANDIPFLDDNVHL